MIPTDTNGKDIVDTHLTQTKKGPILFLQLVYQNCFQNSVVSNAVLAQKWIVIDTSMANLRYSVLISLQIPATLMFLRFSKMFINLYSLQIQMLTTCLSSYQNMFIVKKAQTRGHMLLFRKTIYAMR
jgi:hypothetical protein